MENVFLELMNRSINASWLVLAIVLLRRLLKKSPKTFIIVLWALVGIRLVCPFSPESVLSLIPDPEPIPADILCFEQTAPLDDVVVPNIGGSAVSEAVSHVRPIGSVEVITEKAGSVINTVQLLTAVWVIGMLILLTYAAVSSFRLRRKLDVSIPLRENIRICDDIDTPFILGVFRPRIYLPSSLSAEDAGYAIAHERAHLARHDNLWKLFGFLLLIVFWFNPIMWIAHALFCRDIELACDEEVIRQLGTGSKKSYLNALINCSASRRAVAFRPLAFGEIAVKERVKMILQYKKSKRWLNVITMCICVALAFCFLTNPISAVDESMEQPPEELSTVEVPAATSSSEKIDEIVEESEAPETSEISETSEIPTNEKEDLDDLEALKKLFAGYPEDQQDFFARAERVLCHRIQTFYGSYEVGGTDYNYELPDEIVEKYGTRDPQKLPQILVFESIGELDSTETVRIRYTKLGENGKRYVLDELTEIVTIKIPAGGVAFYVMEHHSLEERIYGGFGTISATYGDYSINLDEDPRLKK